MNTSARMECGLQHPAFNLSRLLALRARTPTSLRLLCQKLGLDFYICNAIGYVAHKTSVAYGRLDTTVRTVRSSVRFQE